jgi:hypoxanthine phosphoribosyltransferase
MNRPIPVLFSAQQISERVHGMASEIAVSMPQEIVIISLLKGGFIFTADLIRALHRTGMKPQVDFMTLRSYGKGVESSGKVDILQDIHEEVAGRHVLIVDDILESGRTLVFARNLIESRQAASVKMAVLLEKPGKRKVTVDADFVGFTVPDKFVVGYGLDYAGFLRELPFIGSLEAN